MAGAWRKCFFLEPAQWLGRLHVPPAFTGRPFGIPHGMEVKPAKVTDGLPLHHRTLCIEPVRHTRVGGCRWVAPVCHHIGHGARVPRACRTLQVGGSSVSPHNHHTVTMLSFPLPTGGQRVRVGVIGVSPHCHCTVVSARQGLRWVSTKPPQCHHFVD